MNMVQKKKKPHVIQSMEKLFHQLKLEAKRNSHLLLICHSYLKFQFFILQ